MTAVSVVVVVRHVGDELECYHIGLDQYTGRTRDITLYSVHPVLMADREYSQLTYSTRSGDLPNRHEIGLRFE